MDNMDLLRKDRYIDIKINKSNFYRGEVTIAQTQKQMREIIVRELKVPSEDVRFSILKDTTVEVVIRGSA